MSDAVRPLDESRLGNDRALLDQYARSQEPAAFLELSRRYAGMVYATCLRITGNAHDAEELTQDCFFELARRASTVCSSVGGWLHRLATHRALNAVRSRTRRRKHEQHAATAIEMRAEPPAQVSWRDVEPLVDRAVEDLPEELRTPILLHYLENRSQSEVAAQLSVHQSTVSRRIQEGLERLRGRLRDSGVVVAVAPLAGLLTANMVHPADPQLLASLGKIALAGAGSSATGKAVGGLGVSSVELGMWAKAGALAAIALLGAALCLGVSITWLLTRRHMPPRSATTPQTQETGLLSVPVLLPSGQYDRSGELAYEPGLRIRIQASQPVRWRLLRNRTVVHETEGLELDVPVTEPGEFRVEAWRKFGGEDRVVLISKPLHVRPASSDSAIP
jgi:RNA polymerase sigma factor (sigma-70 family)